MNDSRKNSPARETLLWIGSTWVGVAIIGVLVVYMALATTVPARLADVLRVRLADPSSNTQPELFRYPPFVALCLAMCVNLTVATVTRIPLRWRNAGAWCTHAGLLVLAIGALWYTIFSTSGSVATVRVRPGVDQWEPITYRYFDAAAPVVYVTRGAEQPVQTPIEQARTAQMDMALDLPVEGGGQGVEIRATRFYRAVRVEEKLKEGSVARMRIIDGEREGPLQLVHGLPEHNKSIGTGYVIVYRLADVTPEQLKQMLAATGPDQAPRMPIDLAEVLTGPDVPPTLLIRRPDGTKWHGLLEMGKPLEASLGGRTIQIVLTEFFKAAVEKEFQIVKPGADAPGRAGHDHGRMPPQQVLEVEVRSGDFRKTVYLPHAKFEVFIPPQRVALPNNRTVQLTFSQPREKLPFTLKIKAAEFRTYLGSGLPEDYRCDVEVLGDGPPRTVLLSLNNPLYVGRFQFFQSSWGRNVDYIMLGAPSRPGLPIIWLGCILICLGFPIAFYLKPLIARRRRRAHTPADDAEQGGLEP